VSGPREARLTIVLAHGAGLPMDSPFMERMAAGLAERGHRVVRFEFPYMDRLRREGRRGAPDPAPVLRRAWLSVIERLGGGRDLVIGGKSLGGRIASTVADEAGARGLVCLGYPFHAPGRPERPRTAHLAALVTPTLVVQGTRDPFGRPEEIARYGLSPAIRIVYLEDGDHAFEPRRRAGRTHEQNLAQAIAEVARFVDGL
jgi:predicted alpha/beta-hydrolase family hydrolase